MLKGWPMQRRRAEAYTRRRAVGKGRPWAYRALGLLQNKSKTHERYENVRSRVRNNKRIELDLD